MKTAWFIFLTIFCRAVLFSQDNNEAWQKYINQAKSNAGQYRTINIHSPSAVNTPPPGDKLSIAQLLTPDSLKKFINRQTTKALPPGILNTHALQTPRSNNLCIDTSFARLLYTYASWIYVQNVIPMADGGILIAGLMYNTTKPDFTRRSYALLIKTDDLGNVVWIKQFDNADAVTFSTFLMYNAFELSNKDIICVGTIDTTSSGSSSNTIIYRLDKNGNIIWQNGLHTSLVSSYPTIPIDIRSVAEGLNGDLILCGTTDSYNGSEKIETIIRLNNLGNIVWDANYANNGPYLFGAEGIAIYVQNGQVVEVGLSHGTGNPITPAAINFLTLDYNTGKLLKKRFFRPDYNDKNEEFRKNFSYYENHCTRLSNGNLVVYGKLFSDYINETPIIDHFGVVEFDAAFDLIKAYTISSGLQTNYSSNQLYFNESGKGLVSLFEYKGPYDGSLYFGAFEKQQFQNQRKADYSNIVLPANRGFRYTNDNGYIFTQSYFEGGTESFVELKKMHNSDTSSICLGRDTFFMQFLPLKIIEDPNYYYLDSNISDQIQAVHYNLTQNDTLKVLTADPCRQINYCDSIKIHGNPVICGSQPSVLFTAYKNPSCGGIIQWNIDPAGIDSLEVQNDSSVLVHFKNINWQGKLHAYLPTGKCYIPATDSIQVNVIRLQTAINLGPDTVLCKSNTMALHAGDGFSSYKWQNGSTDSVLIVSNPGKYYVSAIDKCGNSFSDTIVITAANFPFSIGNDTLRCNNDAIQLTATDGFINYKWQPFYNISADTGRTVTVLPGVNTFYIGTAEKWPGCIMRDTVSIQVFTSPPIRLGNDTSFCTGQSLTLNAGAGFNTYAWSDGAVTPEVTVSEKGIYFVKATTANGCISSDTLQIVDIASLPVFSLGRDTILCRDTVYSYNFNLTNAVYLWSDGSSSNQYNINQPGVYSLAVTQQGCTGKDTVVIGYKENPVADLGHDTTVCSGNSYLLDATYTNAAYLWQDGSTQPGFLVRTAGNYYVAVKLNGCIAKDTVRINYSDKPQFTLGRDTFICQGQAILLQPQLNVQANYLWQDGSTQPNFVVKESGLYSLMAANICGSFSDEVLILPGSCNLMLPNAFTPGRDGLNDVFRVKYPFSVKEFRLSIFNRFGEKVFETTDMNKGWDGTYRSLDQPVGIYVWVIKLKSLSNVEQTSRGMVTLIK